MVVPPFFTVNVIVPAPTVPALDVTVALSAMVWSDELKVAF
jgi:hypothetical protein